jgi:predicted metal-dependent enzyme (double-stranded beta helix superfamily)
MAVFEKELFVEQCRAALKGEDARATTRELMSHAVSNPSQIIRALGEPTQSGFDTIYRADDLTILNLCWGPGLYLPPHNHCMWAIIGIYGGREDNVFYRRNGDGLIRHGTQELNSGDTVPLGESIIHSVRNPLDKITGAIHVYGGDFFAPGRSEWDPENFEERPYDVDKARKAFAEANARLNRA